jgi:hypothetical protein
MYKNDREHVDDDAIVGKQVICDECKSSFVVRAAGIPSCRSPNCDRFFCHPACAHEHMSYCGHSRELLTSDALMSELQREVEQEERQQDEDARHASDPVIYRIGHTY